MAMFYPIESTPLMHFSPLRHEPATSLTQHLPPRASAKCLLLGCGEPRNILFTVFNDEHDGTNLLMRVLAKNLGAFQHDYDFTCCDVEPAILGIKTLAFY
jgi:hypothetical protein